MTSSTKPSQREDFATGVRAQSPIWVRNMPVKRQDLKSPAQRSAQALLKEDIGFSDYANKDVLSYIASWTSIPTPKYVQKRLGDPTHQEVVGDIQWDVWVNPDYILYVTDRYVDLDILNTGLEPALKALRWDMGMSDDLLGRQEYRELMSTGEAEGSKHAHDFPSLDDDRLRTFVLDYLSGDVFCDHHVRDSRLLGSVFIPLALGAFSLNPAEGEDPSPAYRAQKTLSDRYDPGPKPTPPDPLMRPEKGSYPPKPKMEDLNEPDPKRVTEIQYDIDMDVCSPDRLKKYLEVVELSNVGIRFRHEQAMASWLEACQEVDRTYVQRLEDWEKAVSVQEPKRKAFEEDLLQWRLQDERKRAIVTGFHSGYIKNLGVIYEYRSKSLSRSINGYPMFSSLRTLSRTDWDRARKVITQEIERREKLEI